MTSAMIRGATRVALFALVCTPAFAGAAPLIPAPAPRVEGTRWALLVAVDAYSDERVSASKGAVAAANSVAALLVNRYGFASQNIIKIYDKEATSAKIGETLQRLNLQLARADSLFVLINLASFDAPKEEAAFLVPYDGRLDAPWTLLPLPPLASSLYDLPADPLLAIFDGCTSRWEYQLRQARSSDYRQQNRPPVKGIAPGPAASREFITTCAGTVSGVRESQAPFVLKWLQGRTLPGERRMGRELEKALASPLWSVESTVYGRGPWYGFVPGAGPSDDLAIVADRSRPVEERGDATARLARLSDDRLGSADTAATVHVLLEVAGSGAENTILQQRAVLALGQIPTDEAARGLARLAREDPSSELALTAVRALGGYPPALARPALESALVQDRPIVQRAVLRALVSLRSRESLPKVAALLRTSSDPQVRLACLDALQALGPQDVDVVSTLVDLARDESDPDVSAAAVRVLSQTSAPDRAEVFRERLGAASPAVRRAAAYALGDLTPSEPVSAALMGALKDPDPGVREAAAAVLGRARISQASEGLIAAMRDPSPAVRVAAAGALGRLGDRAAIPSLRSVLASENVDERRAAASALGQVGSVESFSELVRIAVTDGASSVREAAESALEALLKSTRFQGAKAESAVMDSSPAVQATALRWLSRSGDPAWMGLFKTGLSSDDVSVRAAAIDGLVAIGSEPAIALLAHEAGRDDPERRSQAIRALAGIRSPAALTALLSLTDPSVALADKRASGGGAPTVDPAAIEALGAYDDERAINRATVLLDAPNPGLRLAAAGALQRQALALHERGDPRRGITLGEQALRVRQELLGEAHPDIASDLNDLGVMYLAVGDLDRARERLNRSLDLRRRVERPDPGQATTLVNLGTIAMRSGDSKQALAHFFRALEMRQYLFGKDSPEASATLDNIAEAFEKIGDSKQATAYRQQAESNRRQRRPPAEATAD